MFLITTADQRFWKTNEPVLFLGEWCKLFSQKSVWEKLSYEVLPYHWDDRKKLYQDYLYLDKLYERTLFQMRDLLNQIHGVDHSLRYWRIVVGPWLYFFIQILYDRYRSILAAIESGKVINTFISRYNDARWLPQDFPCFLNWYVNDDYNQYIFSRIIEFTDRIPFDIVEMGNGSNHKEKTRSMKNSFAPKKILKKFIRGCGKLTPDRFNQIVLISSYLNIFDLIKLQFSLKQIPYISPSRVTAPEADVDLAAREKLNFKQAKSEFEALLSKMVKEQIPLIYVEGYFRMKECSLKAYPKKPKVIFTANANSSNEAFKFWAGNQVDNGVKLLGFQHGGHYGTGLWSSNEKHEIAISDTYFTWGWKSNIYENTKPIAAAKLNNIRKNARPKKEGKILLIQMDIPRYSIYLYSVPVSSSSMLSYNDYQSRLIRALSEKNKKLLTVRLYINEYGWSQMKQWNNKFPEIECYQGSKSMLDQLKESRLVICTYNGTTYLETFAANFPTVMFWDPNQWELNSSAQPYFEELKRIGILHDTPESAAALVNEISPDPASWWKQPEIQEAKDQFCFQFARPANNWLKEWRAELLKVSNVS